MNSLPRKPRVSRLLISEAPLTFQPTLARVLGLNEAIFLQQVQYWCSKSEHHHDGRVWVYNTIDQWKEQLPFWGTATIYRVVKSLRDRGILLTSSAYNKSNTDRTLWYAIDHDALDTLLDIAESQYPSYQSDEMEIAPEKNPSYQSDDLLIGTETTTKITQEIDRARAHDESWESRYPELVGLGIPDKAAYIRLCGRGPFSDVAATVAYAKERVRERIE